MLEFELNKAYAPFALRISARVEAEWLVLLAPSGAGKSLALNLLAGIVRPDSGWVRLQGETLYDSGRRINLPMRRRRIGYVFQDFALFPHMNVAANIAYGLPPEADRGREVARWLAFFHLEGRERAYPAELSGVQKPRVALALALACRARLLLLDEPLSALDRPIRQRLQWELVRLKREFAVPVLLVTHDFAEAQLLGDRVAVLDNGRLLEEGETGALFARPRSHRTAHFLGVENVWPVRVEAGPAEGELMARIGGLALRIPPQRRFAPGDAGHLCIRAADVRLATDESPRPNALAATVAGLTPEGGTMRVTLRPTEGEGPVLITLLDDYVRGRYGIGEGSRIRVWLPPDKLFLCE